MPPHVHHQHVLSAHPAAAGGHYLQVVGVDVLLGGQGEDLLGAGLEGGPGKLLEVAPRVPVCHTDAEIAAEVEAGGCTCFLLYSDSSCIQ